MWASPVNHLKQIKIHLIKKKSLCRMSPWGRPSSCVRPSLVTWYQLTKEFSSQLLMSKLKGLNNVESTGRTTRSSSNFHQYFKTTIYIRVDWSQKDLFDHLLNNSVSVGTRINSRSAINDHAHPTPQCHWLFVCNTVNNVSRSVYNKWKKSYRLD